ncbi:MAG: small basic family protein [Armatimonadota bacterium]
MTALMPIVALLAGFAAVYMLDITVPAGFASYLSLAALAGMDAVIGGVRAGVEDKFKSDIFLSGFLVNTLLAMLLAYVGEQVGVDIFLAAVVVIGGRIFLNLSLIRRYWLTKVSLAKKET